MVKWIPLAVIAALAVASCDHQHMPGTMGDANNMVKVDNAKCPITGQAISGAPKELTRQFQGKTVGFCCGDCPPVWDKLSDAEKASKLQAAMK